MRGTARRSAYLPALDGLRAFAVTAVVAYHLVLPWSKGGYLGVDVFFVLSGFLITGILAAELDAGGIDLRAFYARRARRLLPALYLMLAVVVAWVLWAGASGVDRVGLRTDVMAALAYVANWRFVLSHQGYFAQFTLPSPLRHTWSLAIEEQFYLLWPLLLLGIWRLARGRRAIILATVVALGAASALAMSALVHPGADPSRVYYGTDTRAFELLTGAALGLILRRRESGAYPGGAMRRWAATGAFAALLALCVSVPDTARWMYHGGFLLACLLTAVVVAGMVGPETGWLGAMLSWPPLRWLGRVSYGIYLWHWPVIDLITPERTGLGRPVLSVLQVAVTLGLTSLSYYLIEQPVRLGILRGGWRWAAPAASVGAVMALVMGLAAPASAARVELALSGPRKPPVASGWPGSASSAATLPPETIPSATSPDAAAAIAAAERTRLVLTGIRTPSAADPLRVLIVGDSVMFDASLGIQAALQATGVVKADIHAILGLGLSQPSYHWPTLWTQWVTEVHPDVVVALVGGWDSLNALSHGAAWYTTLVDQANAILTAQGARVVWLEYPQNRPPDIPGVHHPDEAANEAGRQLVNRVLAQSASTAAATVAFLPSGPTLEDNGRYTAFLPAPDGTLERVRKKDNVHFCPAGAMRVGALVEEALAPVAGLPAPNPTWVSGAWRQDGRYDRPAGTCV
jgi:peptidoglycan/LPS O-acetylase OafA/YrhL